MDNFFSTDLVEASKKHLLFLATLHRLGVTVSPPIRETLRRYVDLWLPLVLKVQLIDRRGRSEQAAPSTLAPPPDIAWLWHCHRLAPSAYEAYVRGRFGCLLEAVPSFAVQTAEVDAHGAASDEAETRQEWNNEHPGEPFFLLVGDGSGNNTVFLSPQECMKRLDGFDLLASMKAQTAFLWQVSRPQFHDEEFLRHGAERYYKFLKLSTFKKDDTIDLMWHTHILSSIDLYNQDCLRVCGHKFYHDDSLVDRTPGAKLDVSFQETDRLWRKHYENEAYMVDGTLYRGEPSRDFYDFSTWDPFAVENRLHIVTVQHVGASSMGNQDTSSLEWRSARRDTVTVSGEPIFIPVNVKKESNGVDPNPQRPGYAFGCGSQGWGYYSLETKEAWEQVWMRLKTKEAKIQAELDALQCRACGYRAFCSPPASHLAAFDSAQSKKTEIRQQRAEVKRIVEASRPPSHGISSDGLSHSIPYDGIMTAAACGGALYAERYGDWGETKEEPSANRGARKHNRAYGAGGGCGGGCGGGGCGGGG